MNFEKIFARLPDADEIYFRKYDVSYCLKQNPKYLEYVHDKIVLRHEIEKKYKDKLTPDLFKQIHNCYRLYLEQLAYKLGKGEERHPLCETDALIQKAIQEFIEAHRFFKKEMENYLLSDEAIGKQFKENGLFSYLNKIEIDPNFFELKNSWVSYSLTFRLTDQSKSILCKAYENPDSTHFDDVVILKNGEWLFWNDEDGYLFKDGYVDKEEEEKERLEEEAFLKANGWILEDDGK